MRMLIMCVDNCLVTVKNNVFRILLSALNNNTMVLILFVSHVNMYNMSYTH